MNDIVIDSFDTGPFSPRSDMTFGAFEPRTDAQRIASEKMKESAKRTVLGAGGEMPSRLQYLQGPSGVGKTHLFNGLLRFIATHVKDTFEWKVKFFGEPAADESPFSSNPIHWEETGMGREYYLRPPNPGESDDDCLKRNKAEDPKAVEEALRSSIRETLVKHLGGSEKVVDFDFNKFLVRWSDQWKTRSQQGVVWADNGPYTRPGWAVQGAAKIPYLKEGMNNEQLAATIIGNATSMESVIAELRQPNAATRKVILLDDVFFRSEEADAIPDSELHAFKELIYLVDAMGIRALMSSNIPFEDLRPRLEACDKRGRLKSRLNEPFFTIIDIQGPDGRSRKTA